jgi:hypothetical protein
MLTREVATQNPNTPEREEFIGVFHILLQITLKFPVRHLKDFEN